MSKIWLDPGSFKDPDAAILHYGGRVYRYFTPEASTKFGVLAIIAANPNEKEAYHGKGS